MFTKSIVSSWIAWALRVDPANNRYKVGDKGRNVALEDDIISEQNVFHANIGGKALDNGWKYKR
jgi:hypothetical protein